MSNASFIFNSYNVLGLASDSSQADVRKRVGLIDKLLAIDEDVEFESDVLIQPSDRTADTVKDCETRLNSPQDKLEDIFFWFADSPEALAAANAQDRGYFQNLRTSATGGGTHDFTEAKNAAVGLSVIFEKSQSESDFDQALQSWAAFIHLDSFWDYWIKYYKAIDYLDTSERLLQEFREHIDTLLTEKFFAVSQLDDLIDARIVGKYFTISTEVAEKAAEQQLSRIKELRVEAESLQNPEALLNGSYRLSDTSKDKINSLLSKATALQKELENNEQQNSPAIARELNSLWDDISGIAIGVHNLSGQHDALTIPDLEFYEQVLRDCKPNDSLSISRLHDNLPTLQEEKRALQERERLEPQISRLEALTKELVNISPSGEITKRDISADRLETKLSEFESIYREVEEDDKLKYEPMVEAVTVVAGAFARQAIDIAAAAVSQLNTPSRLSPSEARSRLLMAATALASAQDILSRLRPLQVDPEVKEAISRNYADISRALESTGCSDLGRALARHSSSQLSQSTQSSTTEDRSWAVYLGAVLLFFAFIALCAADVGLVLILGGIGIGTLGYGLEWW